jgi:ribose 5-phosphate isomerase RpiB
MNMICIGARTVRPRLALDLVETFLRAKYSQAERHLRRLGKVVALESERFNQPAVIPASK